MPERMIIHWAPIVSTDQPRGDLDVSWRWKAVVGRDRDCDIVLKHPSIPKKQGHFVRLRNHWWVQDEQEANGIYLQGKRIHFEAVGQKAIDFAMIVRFRIETVPMEEEELQLRAAISAGPEDDARFLVYADWLQEQGDPVGQLMVSPAPIGERWLGPLWGPGIEVKWRHGFLDTVKVRSALSIYGKNGVFNEVLAHPLSAFLRTLEIDAVLIAAEVDYFPIEHWVVLLLEALRTDAPPTLRRLRVRLPAELRLGLEANFNAALARMPGLETKWEDLFTEGALV